MMTVQFKEAIELLCLTLTLGIDVFFVGASLGASNIDTKTLKRFLIYVGIFHLSFSAVGITLGAYLHQLMGNVSEILGGIIITATGLFFFISSIRARKGIQIILHPNVVSLAFAVSTECFSIGIGVSMHLHMILAMLFGFASIGLLSGYIGIRLGGNMGKHLNISADMLSSLCLIAVGGLFLAW